MNHPTDMYDNPTRDAAKERQTEAWCRHLEGKPVDITKLIQQLKDCIPKMLAYDLIGHPNGVPQELQDAAMKAYKALSREQQRTFVETLMGLDQMPPQDLTEAEVAQLLSTNQ